MPESYKENLELRPSESQMNEVNLEVFHEVVESMIAEKDDNEVIGEGFIWRVIRLYNEKISVLYNQKIGVKMDRDEYKKFCEKIRPKLIGILDANKRKYKFSKTNMPTKKSHGNLHSEKSIEEKGGSERDDASLGVKEEAQSSKINKIPPEHWLDKWGKEQDEKQEAQDNKF